MTDDLCFIKSMHTEQINHDPAVTFAQTGFQLSGRPSPGRVGLLWMNAAAHLPLRQSVDDEI
jgi:hypothetical protein